MKTDVLTIAAVVFVVGLLMSTVSFSEIFNSAEAKDVPLTMQQGAVAR